jgi:methionine aminotransferase
MNEFRKVHQFLVFSVNTPVQHAIAEFLENKYYYLELNDFYQQKRDSFRQLLADSRFELLPCQGSYFQLATYDKISEETDINFCRRITSEFGVAPIPVSAFYTKGTNFGVIRFCFAKKQETLEQAAEKLRKV